MKSYAFFYWYLGAFVLLVPAFFLLFRWWRRPSTFRLLAGNFAIFFLLALFALVIGEGYFYFFYDSTDASLLLLTSKRWVARHVKCNTLGFRGKMPPKAGEPRQPGEIRIGVLGDSFAFGHGIKREEDRFPELLEKRLRDRGTNARVFSLSQIGMGTRDEVLALELLGSYGYAFDMIILAYVMNDHFDQEEFPPEYAAALDRAIEVPRLVEVLVDRSLCVNYLWHRFVTFRRPAYMSYDRAALQLYEKPEVRQRHYRDLDSLIRLCRDSGSRLAVVTFPMMVRPLDQYLLPGMHRDLGQFWRERGISNLDLLDDFRKYPMKDVIVGRLDTHPNELAHRIAAERIMEAFFSGRGEASPPLPPEAAAEGVPEH